MSQGPPTLNLRLGRADKDLRITPHTPRLPRGLHTAMALSIGVMVLPEFAFPGDTAAWVWSKLIAFILCLTLAIWRQRLVKADNQQTIRHESVAKDPRVAEPRRRDPRWRVPVEDVTLIQVPGLGIEIPHDHWSDLFFRKWGAVPQWNEFQHLVHTVKSQRDGERARISTV